MIEYSNPERGTGLWCVHADGKLWITDSEQLWWWQKFSLVYMQYLDEYGLLLSVRYSKLVTVNFSIWIFSMVFVVCFSMHSIWPWTGHLTLARWWPQIFFRKVFLFLVIYFFQKVFRMHSQFCVLSVRMTSLSSEGGGVVCSCKTCHMQGTHNWLMKWNGLFYIQTTQTH